MRDRGLKRPPLENVVVRTAKFATEAVSRQLDRMLIPSPDSSRLLTIQVNGELVLCDVAFLTAEIRITRLIPSSPLLLALHVEANIKAFASKRQTEQAVTESTTR